MVANLKRTLSLYTYGAASVSMATSAPSDAGKALWKTFSHVHPFASGSFQTALLATKCVYLILIPCIIDNPVQFPLRGFIF